MLLKVKKYNTIKKTEEENLHLNKKEKVYTFKILLTELINDELSIY